MASLLAESSWPDTVATIAVLALVGFVAWLLLR